MNKRIFIEKKALFDVHSKSLTKELQILVPNVQCKVFVIYDLFGIKDEELKNVLHKVFANPVTDNVLREIPNEKNFIAVEYLPGQYDQRADSAEQCLRLTGVEFNKIKTGEYYQFNDISKSDLEKIKSYLINPIECREKDLQQLYLQEDVEIKPVLNVEGFIDFSINELNKLHKDFGFSMGMDDLEFIQKHFQSIRRNPTETELKVLDTYWSDHCRHTTFETEITNIKIENQFKETIENTLNYYLKLREELKITKPIRLMDLATIMGKYLSKNGKVSNIDISEEINACSIVVSVDVDGKEEEWLLQFKNETHNHPTEVEPYGGASTCVGGAIRDPLSGRAYVFQAMRITGAANPLEKIEDTLPGKLPQRKITKEAAHGYSSYGNQIGLATTYVKEIYDEGYKAKRMEVGFVAGAVKKEYVRREEPKKGDKIILLGGRTGRDGIGGATGSSKTHDGQKLDELSSEVQKGNAIVERKIQRLFRNKEVLALIKKCNDFGAGGVSVAIGEIARGININLDKIPLKYTGLNGTELALSESQERMAVVVEDKDAQKFIDFSSAENLEATVVAEVTDDETMTMHWKGDVIVELDRKFLDTNGVRKQAKAKIKEGEIRSNPFETKEFTKENYLELLTQLNHTSQKGLVEMFDANIGRSTVLMPFGGKTQDTPEDISVQKFPTEGFTHTVSMASFGYNPTISRWSPYHGAYYAVVDSVAKIIAGGGKHEDIRLTFQEYFERLGEDEERWGKPFAALLGSIEAQRLFEIPAIGGKDSMSGSYQDIDVPPTLISFAVSPNKTSKIKSATLQNADSKLSTFIPKLRKDYLLDENSVRNIYSFISKQNDFIHSMMTVKFGGIAETLSLMAFGNEIGFKVNSDLEMMKYYPGAILIEHKADLEIPKDLQAEYNLLGITTFDSAIKINSVEVSIKEAKKNWKSTLSELFPYKAEVKSESNNSCKIDYVSEKNIYLTQNKTAKPNVFVPIFPGTNSEYDSEKAFRREGAKTSTLPFRNLSDKDIITSVEAYAKEVDNSQIVFFPGGFSAADEPDGSGKFIAAVLQNEKIKESIHKLLERDGLILGVCNGFQALIKSGLLPYGEIKDLEENSPTLTFNEIGRHISQVAKVKVNKTNSPWLKEMEGQSYWIPFSHGEGKFIADEENLKILKENNQIATQYIDLENNLATEMPYNPNGSVCSIEGIVSPCGKVYGRMGHPERFEEGLMKNIPEIKYMNIFKNGVEYFG